MTQLRFILPLLDMPCTHFVDVFGGSGAVILNRPPAPVETYNDMDGELCNFFRVVRDHPNEIIRLLSYTPYSREEFKIACHYLKKNDQTISPIERARLYFTKAKMTFLGMCQTNNSWSNSKKDSKKGMAESVSSWHGSVDMISRISNRLLRVQIENAPALRLIKRLDSPDTLFYCDPPYPFDQRQMKSKAYQFEMSNDDHEELAEVLGQCVGKVAISFYNNEPLLIERLYPSKKWKRNLGESKVVNNTSKTIRQELVLTNY